MVKTDGPAATGAGESIAHDESAGIATVGAADRWRHVVFLVPAKNREGETRVPGRRPVSARVASRVGRFEYGREDVARRAGERGERSLDSLDRDIVAMYERIFGAVSIRADRYRASVLQRRAAACLRAIGAGDAARAIARVDDDPSARERALHAIAIGVTSFFRDPQVFRALEFPLRALAARRSAGLRILSLGCSDGRELYSMALLLEACGIEGAALHGVDCRREAIDAAREGVYPVAELDTVPPRLRDAYFEPIAPHGDALRLRDSLRRRCTWEVGDIFACEAREAWDVVLCRNVLIYHTAESAGELWQRLCASVASDGIVVLGKGERPARTAAAHRIAPGVYVSTSGWR